MSSVNSSKKLVNTIVKVVRNNNKLMFYNESFMDIDVPKRVIYLDS